MDTDQWHDRYKKRLMDVGGLSDSEAQDSLKAGLGEYDHNDTPEDCADEEMSYWTND